MTIDNSYFELACKLLGNDLDTAPLHVPMGFNDSPEPNPGDLTDFDDQRLAIKLEIGPHEWETLNEDQRMARMQAVVNSNTTAKTGRPPKEETPAEMQVIAALQTILADTDNYGLDSPPTGKEIANLAGIANVSRFVRKLFGSQQQFEAAWRRDDVRTILAKREYAPEPHATFDEQRQSKGGNRRRSKSPNNDND